MWFAHWNSQPRNMSAFERWLPSWRPFNSIQSRFGKRVSNASRYTPSGRILIGCRRRLGNRLSIEVHDTGIGIPGDQIAKIFDDFYQVSTTVTDRSLGLGLGLAIARRLADLLDHGISVRSFPGRGSSFALLVPLGVGARSTERAEPPKARRRSLTNRTILILENDPTVSSALAAILREWGATAMEAATIDEALESLATSAPDIVIADYQLEASENGIDALNHLEARLRRKLPAIILSGDTAPEDLRKMRDSGHYILSKPTQPGRLRALLDICLTR
jgi:CheY-like chemotaxis protein